MTLSWTTSAELQAELERFGPANLKELLSLCGHEPWNEPSLLLAVASRETWCQNIDGDPMNNAGHGKGAWQIDVRFWFTFLNGIPAVANGTWGPVLPGKTAADYGCCPTLADGLKQALAILSGNHAQALGAGLTSQALAAAVAGYNAGIGGALEGYRTMGNPDRYTTGANYSADVFQRQVVFAELLVALKPKPDPLALLTPYEREIVTTYEAQQKHSHLHRHTLPVLRGKIADARRAIYRAAQDGIAGGAKVEKGWHVEHRLARYRILYHLVPPTV